MKRAIKIVGLGLLSLCLLVVILVVILGLIPDSVEIPAGTSGRYLAVRGAKIRYHQTGAGPDLLLIHGLPGSIEDWGPLERLLAPAFRLTLIDRPGHGYSDAGGHDYTVQHNAEVALAVIEALRLREVTVVGHSYGGATVMAMAVRNPPAVKAFVSVSGVVHRASGEVDPNLRALDLPVIGRGLAALGSKLAGPGMLEEGVRAAFRPNTDAMPPDFMARAERIWLTRRVSVTLAKERIRLATSLAALVPRYGSIRKRLLLVHGRRDEVVPFEQSVKVQRMVKGAELIALDRVGHYPQFACPERLAAIIKAWAGD